MNIKERIKQKLDSIDEAVDYNSLTHTEIDSHIGTGKKQRKPDGFSFSYRGEIFPLKSKNRIKAKEEVFKLATEKGIKAHHGKLVQFWKIPTFGGRIATIEDSLTLPYMP